MYTRYDPEGLRDVVVELTDRDFHWSLLYGRRRWDLTDMSMDPTSRHCDEDGNRRNGLSMAEAEGLRCGLIRHLAAHGYVVEMEGRHATIRAWVEAPVGYPEAVPLTAVPEVPGMLVISAHASGTSQVPLCQCQALRRTNGRWVRSTLYVVGERGFVDLPVEWSINMDLKQNLDSALRDVCWFDTPLDAALHQNRLTTAYMLRLDFRNGDLPAWAISEDGTPRMGDVLEADDAEGELDVFTSLVLT